MKNFLKIIFIIEFIIWSTCFLLLTIFHNKINHYTLYLIVLVSFGTILEITDFVLRRNHHKTHKNSCLK